VAVSVKIFNVVWDQFMRTLKKNALSAGPDFLGEVGILHATTHARFI
jgi:hypothetical protein